MSIVSLVIAPHIAINAGHATHTAETLVPLEEEVELLEVPAGELSTLTLENGVRMDVPQGGLEGRLFDFIRSAEPADKADWFNFDRLLFESGSAQLKPASEAQLKNVADLLKSFPGVSVRIGGYTDNTGEAARNLQLSGERAQAVRQRLCLLYTSPSPRD